MLGGSLVIVVAASGFGILGPLARFGYDAGLDPLSFVAWRATFALIVIGVVVAVLDRRGRPVIALWRLPPRDRWGILAVGLAGFALNVSMFVAFGLTSIAIALLAFYTYPSLVAVTAAALGHERLDSGRIAALVLALAGMVLVVGGSLGSSGAVSVHPLGVLLGLGAAVGQTAFVTISRSRFETLPPEQAMGWIIAITAVGCTIVALLAGSPFGIVFRRTDALGLAVLGGVVGAGIPSVLFLIGIRAIGAVRAGILMLIEPLVGVSLAALLLHEGVAPVQVLGGAAILVAAVLVQRGTTRETIEPAGVPSVEHG